MGELKPFRFTRLNRIPMRMESPLRVVISQRETLAPVLLQKHFQKLEKDFALCWDTSWNIKLTSSRSEKWQRSMKSFPAKRVTSVGWPTSDATPNRTPAKSGKSQNSGNVENFLHAQARFLPQSHTSRKTGEGLQYAAWQSTMSIMLKIWFEHLLPIFYRETQTSLAGTPMSFALSEA